MIRCMWLLWGLLVISSRLSVDLNTYCLLSRGHRRISKCLLNRAVTDFAMEDTKQSIRNENKKWNSQINSETNMQQTKSVWGLGWSFMAKLTGPDGEGAHP